MGCGGACLRGAQRCGASHALIRLRFARRWRLRWMILTLWTIWTRSALGDWTAIRSLLLLLGSRPCSTLGCACRLRMLSIRVFILVARLVGFHLLRSSM